MNKKIFEWLKSNWIKIVVVVAISFISWRLYFFSEINETLFKENQKQSEIFHEQLKKIEIVNNQLRLRQDDLERKYKTELEQIKQNYDQRISELSKIKKDNELKIIKDAKQDPKTLTDKVQNLFGIPMETK